MINSRKNNIAVNHYMCSQSGNIQDLSLSSIGPDGESDTSSRQDFIHTPSQPSEIGLRYMTLNPPDDVRFPEAGTPNSSICSIEPSVSNYAPSASLNYTPFTPLYHHTLNGGTYSNNPSSYYPTTTTYLSMSEKPNRLNSFNATSGLGSLSRSPGLPQISSPTTTRDLYTSTTPHLRRTSDLLSRSPSHQTNKGFPLSPSSSIGYTSSGNMESSLGSACPPMHGTEVLYQIQGQDGNLYKPEIYAKIDKGFFLSDKDWTCYRRNYFSLNCSYTILPSVPSGNLYLTPQHGGGEIFGFAMSISAVVDGHDGKPIELVQHTPKRDKGPQNRPDRIPLRPRPANQHGMYGSDNTLSNLSGGLYDPPGFSANPNQPPFEAVFERIQFKNATANNGKRRAAQQYYHLIVELFADMGEHRHPDQYVKIATKMSAQMVVRGRSPGHYHSERRGSNASSGPGSGGASGGGSYPPSNISRTPGDINIGGTSSHLPGSGFGGGYDGRSHHYRANIPPLQIPLEPTMSAEEAKSIEESPHFLYYPAAIFEGHEPKYQLPSVSEYTTTKIKNEYGSGGYMLPSLTNTDGLNRHCGRWEGIPESKGYFPTALIQQELNIT